MSVIREFKASIGDLTLISDTVALKRLSDWTLLHDGSPISIDGEFSPEMFREIAALMVEAAIWLEEEQ